MDDDLTKRLRDADHVAFAQITEDLSVRCSEDYALAEQAADTIDALRERVKVLEGAARELVDALDAVDREAERAEQPGATAWSSAPAVRLIHARDHVRTALKDADT